MIASRVASGPELSAGTWNSTVQVRREYGLTIDRAEARCYRPEF